MSFDLIIQKWFDPDLDAPVGGGTQSASVTEATTPADASTAQANFNAAITEATSPAETETAQATFAASITEATSPADSQDATRVQAAAITEALAPVDTSTGDAAMGGSETESVTPADTQTVQATFAASQSESVAPADAATAQVVFAADRAEAVAAADTESAQATFASSEAESLAPADTSDGSLGTQIYNDSITESAAVTASQDAVLVTARSGGRNPFAKFTPYAEVGVSVKPLSIAARLHGVSATALDKSKTAAVSVAQVYGRFALRPVNAGGGAMVSVRPLSVYVSARVIDVGWTGVSVATTVLPAARSSCVAVDVRVGCTISTRAMASARVDIKMLSAKAVRAVRNPTDEELATAALALLRASRRR